MRERSRIRSVRPSSKHPALAPAIAVVAGALACLTPGVAAAQAHDSVSAPAPSVAPPAATHPTVVIHVDAPQPVTLQARDDGGEWQTICTSPCDKPVVAAEQYRVVGSGIRTSKTFHLDSSGAGAPVSLQVEPSSSGEHAIGVVVTVLGVVALVPAAGITTIIVGGEIIGLILICPIATAFVSQNQQSSEYGNCLGSIATFFGQGYAEPYVWGPALVGAALLTTGIVLLVNTPRSAVKQGGAAAAFALPAPTAPLPLLPAVPAHYEALSLPPAITTPIVNLSF